MLMFHTSQANMTNFINNLLFSIHELIIWNFYTDEILLYKASKFVNLWPDSKVHV